MTSLSDLKKKRANKIGDLAKKAEEAIEGTSKKKDYSDDRYWKIERDPKTGNGSAVIRFLPCPKIDEDRFDDSDKNVDWVIRYSHGFQGPGGWYIELSRTTLGEKDPVSESNSEAWNNGDQDLARKRKRRKKYISGIKVIKDPANPANEGKEFLFEYGQKIFNKINQQLKGDAEFGIAPCDIFDFWEGKNFAFKVKQDGEFPNYDDSTFFSNPSVIGTDEEIKNIWESSYSLQDEISEDKFKSYEDLKKRFNMVVNGSSSSVEDEIEKESAKVEEEIMSSTSSSMEDTSSGDDVDDDFDKLMKEFGNGN